LTKPSKPPGCGSRRSGTRLESTPRRRPVQRRFADCAHGTRRRTGWWRSWPCFRC
jgi:hypothetical protein